MDLLLTVSPFGAAAVTVIGTLLAIADWYVWGETFRRYQTANPKPLRYGAACAGATNVAGPGRAMVVGAAFQSVCSAAEKAQDREAFKKVA
jgi:hypothetical protein